MKNSTSRFYFLVPLMTLFLTVEAGALCVTQDGETGSAETTSEEGCYKVPKPCNGGSGKCALGETKVLLSAVYASVEEEGAGVDPERDDSLDFGAALELMSRCDSSLILRLNRQDFGSGAESGGEGDEVFPDKALATGSARDLEVLRFTAGGRLYIPRPRLRPFGEVGLGFYEVDESADIGGYLGVGLDYQLTYRWNLELFAEYQLVPDADLEVANLSVSIGYRF